MQQADEADPVIIKEWRSDLNRHVLVQHLDCPKGFSRSEDREVPMGNDRIRRRSSQDRGMRVSNRSRKQSKQWITSVVERSVLRYSAGG